MFDEIKKGSFIVETQKHLQVFENPSLRLYKATLFSGKAGRILGKLRGQEVLSGTDKIAQFAAETGEYDENNLLKNILPRLENHGCIDIYHDKSGKISKIEENISSEKQILKIVSEVWQEENPTIEEQISLESLDYCSRLPRLKSELRDFIDESGFSSKFDAGIDLAKIFKLIQEYEHVAGIDESVYHTPLYVRENIVSIANVLNKLPYPERMKLDELLSSTKATEANPVSQSSIDQQRLKIYNKIGLMDVTRVETRLGRKENFLFTPAIWGPLGNELTRDEQEHVRALLSCIRFGQICPTKVGGRSYGIRNPEMYIEALESRGRIGPSTPIGNDYIILEREGIVRIERSKSKPDQFEMVLLKRDIAERARRIISRGRDISLFEDKEDINPPIQSGEYKNTAKNRIENMPKIKKTGDRSKLLENVFLKVLRGERD